MVPYLDHNYEYYCSGSFFANIHQLNGEEVFNQAQNGDKAALKLYQELGVHLSNAIKLVMYTYDPELIILGGSVSNAYTFFEKDMWRTIKTFAYPKSAERLQIKTSSLQNSAIWVLRHYILMHCRDAILRVSIFAFLSSLYLV